MLPSPAHHQVHKGSARPSLSSIVSLDRIASLSERPTPSRSAAAGIPLGPCSTIIQYEPATPRRSTDLWKHIPSSPIISLSSPSLEEARLAHLPSEAKTFRSLEWACLKARKERVAKSERRCPHSVDAKSELVGVVDRVATPPLRMNGLIDRVRPGAPSEDVEAAVTLLGIKSRS